MTTPGDPEDDAGPAPAPARSGRLRRTLARLGVSLGLGTVFAGALAGGVLLHLDLPASRRATERALRSILDGIFEGTLEPQGIEHLGLDGVVISQVVVRDPGGLEVIRARGVRAEASVSTIVRNALGSGDLHVDLPFVRIDQAEVLVEPNAQGQISIAAAFTLRPTPQAPAGRDVYLLLPHVEIGSASVRGRPDGTRPLDADVRHLIGSVHVMPGSVAIDVEPTGIIERKELPGVIAGTAEYHLRVFGPKNAADTATADGTRMWATFGGHVGNVELVARGLMEGAHVELSAHAPRARPELVKLLVAGYPIADAVEAHVEATGDLPNLDVRVTARTEHSGSASVEGHLDLSLPLRADLTFRTQALEPRTALATFPDMRITSTGKVHAEIGALVSVRVEAQTEPTLLDGTPIPAADIVALFDGFSWSGTVKLDEPGAPIEGTFATQRDGSVKLDATAKIASLANVPRIPSKLGGSGTVHASGVVRDAKLDVTLSADVQGFRAGSNVAVRQAHVHGSLSGPVGSLVTNTTVSAKDMTLGGIGVRTADVSLSGPILTPSVHARLVNADDTLIDAAGALDTQTGTALGVKLRVERDGAVAMGQIARIGQKGGGIGIQGVALESPDFGKINGSLAVVGGELAGTLHAKDVDLAAVRTLLRLPANIAGRADVDVALTPVRGGRKGTVRLALRQGAIATVSGVSGTVTATFDADRITTDGELAITGTTPRCSKTIANVRLSGGDGRLAGHLLSPSTWLTATGQVDVAAQDWDLECVAAFVPLGLPISAISGTLSTQFSLARQKDDRFPSIHDFAARTQHLVVLGPKPLGASEPQWASRHIDVQLTGDINGATGETTVGVAVADPAPIADTSFAVTLDLAALLDPAKRMAMLARAPVAGRFSIARRSRASLVTLPAPLYDQIPSFYGEARIDAYVHGTPLAPAGMVRVTGWNLAPGPDKAGVESPWATALNVDAAAVYIGTKATIDAHVQQGGHEIATLDAVLDVPLVPLLRGDPGAGPTLTGRASARLSELSLAAVPFLGSHEIRGHLSGRIDLDDIGQNPTIAVDLQTSDLALGPDLEFDDGRVTVRTQRSKSSPDTIALATAHLSDKNGGSLDASGYVSVGWEAGLLPAPREDRPADLYVKLAKFRLATLEPLVAGTLRELDGFVDGGVRLGWGRLDETEKGTLDCDLRVTGGSFYIPQIGQQFRLVEEGKKGPLRILANRAGVLRVENLVAQGNSGRVRGSVLAHLDGLAFKNATGELTIAANEALPLTLEGAPVGNAWGTLKLSAETRERTLAIDIRSSNLHLALPASSSRNVQSLDDNSDIHPSHDLHAPELPRAEGARNYSLVLHLENALIEGSGIRIGLSTVEASPPTVLVAARTYTKGDIVLTNGTVEVMGRKFVLEQGLVRLRENEASNPYLNVTAHWDAPDGSRVFVDYIGVLDPITNDKLRFRSNPPRSQQETLALLLFGSEEGTSIGTDPNSGGSFGSAVGEAAVGIGGELAAQQFNQLLAGIEPLKGLSTRFGTTEAGSIKTSLVYEIGDTVTALATYEGAAPVGSVTTSASGTGDGMTGSTSIAIDWRFYKNWLIRASVGTTADVPKGEVDLLWQYRY
jgi:translocation and assembly module TamB